MPCQLEFLTISSAAKLAKASLISALSDLRDNDDAYFLVLLSKRSSWHSALSSRPFWLAVSLAKYSRVEEKERPLIINTIRSNLLNPIRSRESPQTRRRSSGGAARGSL